MAEHEEFDVKNVKAWREELKAAKEDVKDISDLGYILQKNTDGLSKAQAKTNKNLGIALDASVAAAKAGKMNLAQLKRRKDIIGKIAGEELDLKSVKSEQRKLDLEILKIQRRYTGANKEKGKQLIREVQKDKQLLKIEQSRLETQDKVNQMKEAGGQLDDQFGGFAKKLKGFLVNPLTAALALLVAFNATQEDIAKDFGAIGVTEFRKDISSSQKEFKKLGFGAADANKSISDLANNFGLSVAEASKLSKIAAETAAATGLSTDNTSSLIGLLTQTQGLSGDQANELIRSTQALAKANDVAPDKVLEDVAGNTEQFARFAKDGGENVLRAAIQARKLGINLDTVAKTSEGLLNFQDSLTKEIEASTLIGRQLNLQKARELALAGDLEGVQKEILNAVGSEADFNKMNAIQRQALADAVGLQSSELQKLVSAEKEAVTLQGELSKQPIDKIVSEKAITETAALIKNLKVMGLQLAETLGPAVNVVAQIFGGLVKVLEKLGGLLPPLIALTTVYAGKKLLSYLATEKVNKAEKEGILTKIMNLATTAKENIMLGFNTSQKKGNTLAEVAKQATEKGSMAQMGVLLGIIGSYTAALYANTVGKLFNTAATNKKTAAENKGMLSTMASTGKNIISAVSEFFLGAGKMSSATFGFGTIAAVAIAALAVGAMLGSIASAQAVGDMHMQAGGGPVVTTPRGERFEGSIRDEVLMAPNIAGAGGGNTAGLESKQNKTNEKLERVASVLEGALSGPKPALARAMGGAVGDTVDGMA
jgi:hypothetical protein